MNKSIVILSGGMDSTTLTYEVVHNFGNKNVTALSFDYGQRHKKELDCAKLTCKKLNIKHKILSLDVLNQVAPSALTRSNIDVPEGHYAEENMKQTVVPNRNMVMLSLAAAYAMGEGVKYLFYGAHAGDHSIYPDCRKEFVDSMKQSIKLADWNEVELHAPYLTIDKSIIAKLGKVLNVDYSLTWTCYKGLEKACGKCGSCVERLEAFDIAEMKDPIEYE
jgi:7-cyano-7-deazaguanine synthase